MAGLLGYVARWFAFSRHDGMSEYSVVILSQIDRNNISIQTHPSSRVYLPSRNIVNIKVVSYLLSYTSTYPVHGNRSPSSQDFLDAKGLSIIGLRPTAKTLSAHRTAPLTTPPYSRVSSPPPPAKVL